MGIRLCYAIQPKPEGLAQAFLIGADFIDNSPVSLVLGDNIFFGHGLPEMLAAASARDTGATIFAYQVRDPERYGVVSFDDDGRATGIVEKPKNAPSNWAVTGLYFYDKHVVRYAAKVKPSSRGELEITDLNMQYLDAGALEVARMGRGFAWLDTGTFESLIDAAFFVQTLEQRQGMKIACPEEIAYRMGFIDRTRLLELAHSLVKSGYGDYLAGLVAATTREFDWSVKFWKQEFELPVGFSPRRCSKVASERSVFLSVDRPGRAERPASVTSEAPTTDCPHREHFNVNVTG